MTNHSSVLGALDAFWATLRRQAERDPTFASQLANSLSIPVDIKIESSADVTSAMPHLDPVVIAGRGLDEFRSVFGRLKDADLRKIIKAYNLAPSEAISGKGAPKGEALVAILWDAAQSQRKRLQDRAG